MIRLIGYASVPIGSGNGNCLTPWVGVSVAEKPRTFRRVALDALVSACALGILLAGLVAMDGGVRERLSMQMDSAKASTEIAATTGEARKLATVVYQIVKEQSEEHGPLMAMLAVGTVLAVVMFRT